MTDLDMLVEEIERLLDAGWGTEQILDAVQRVDRERFDELMREHEGYMGDSP